jgi:TPR repeat protein
VAWWKKAAIQGHIDAQYELGIAYADGKGVIQNDAQAVYKSH